MSEPEHFAVVSLEPSKTIFYAPNPGYDAYWINGEWVFGTTTTTATTTTDPSKTQRTNYPYIKPRVRPLVCGKVCPAVYKKIKGAVCGHVVNNLYDPAYDGEGSQNKGLVDWRQGGVLDRNYRYLRTYESYCHFMADQCRANIYHHMGLIFIHMGACLEDEDAFPALFYGQNVKNRKLKAVKIYTDQIKQRFKDAGKHRPLRARSHILYMWVLQIFVSLFKYIMLLICIFKYLSLISS